MGYHQQLIDRSCSLRQRWQHQNSCSGRYAWRLVSSRDPNLAGVGAGQQQEMVSVGPRNFHQTAFRQAGPSRQLFEQQSAFQLARLPRRKNYTIPGGMQGAWVRAALARLEVSSSAR
jgi:hypothetical protein